MDINMCGANQETRILGLAMQPIVHFRDQPHAKSTGLYAALDRHFNVVGVIQPELPKADDYLNKLLHVHPDRVQWQARIDLNPWAFRRRTAIADEQLKAWQGQYDLIMQLHTLVAPGLSLRKQVYTIHTDNTYILSERHYPKWAPLHGRQRDEWLRLEQETYQQAAFLFPRSEFLRRSFIEDYGCDPQRVIRVGGGANLSTSSIDSKRYDSQIALFVGGDFERKGGETLLQAWEGVHSRLPEAQLWIVGPKHQVAANCPGVRWFGRIADRTLLGTIYAQASLFVLPSLFEPWGHVFLEAMGYGLPCVGTTHCAMPEIIQDHVTGLLVPPADAESLSEALVTLMRDPPLLEQMGRQGHTYVQQNCTWDHVVDRMAPYIEQAVSEARLDRQQQAAVYR